MIEANNWHISHCVLTEETSAEKLLSQDSKFERSEADRKCHKPGLFYLPKRGSDGSSPTFKTNLWQLLLSYIWL